MAKPWVVGDFESASACDLKKAGAYRYWLDPTTEILCFAWEDNAGIRGIWWPGAPEAERQKIISRIRAGSIFVAHNCGFERNGWTQQMVPLYGFPEIPISQWHDTSARALQMALPAGLENVLRVLNLGVQKDTEGTKATLSLSRPNRKGYYPERTPKLMQRIYDYCLNDITGQVALHKRIGWLPAHERPIWEMSQRVNDRGVKLDLEFVRGAQKIVDEASGPLALRFAEITGGLKFTQVQKVKAWVQEQGVPIENLAKDTLAKLLGGDEEDPDEEAGDGYDDETDEHVELPVAVREALSIRQLVGSSSVKKLKAMRTCVDYDGRARGLMIYHGTTPGRQTAKLLQPHNFPRGTIKGDPEAKVQAITTGDYQLIEMVYGPAVETVVSSLRHAIVADTDRVFISGDYSGIQARTVLAVAGQSDKTAVMAAGLDVYCDMASQIYKVPVTKADTEKRQVGKNSVLGLGFQMGAPKFHLKYGDGQPLEFCEEVVRVYRQEWAPLVPDLWHGLQKAARDTVWDRTPHSSHGVTYLLRDDWLVCQLPNGSEFAYKGPRQCRRAMPWDETDVRKAWTYHVQKNGRWVERNPFGGQLTENLIMKIEREIMEAAKKKLEVNGFPIVLEVHDEIVSEPLKVDADMKAYQEIMEDVEPWVKAYGIPIQVDCWSGSRYRK